jgi:multimeric flavodoxin WrbA
MQCVYGHLLGAAGVILAAPVFSMNLNALSKGMIDRCQRFWATKYILGRNVVEPSFRLRRRGLFLSVCGRDDPRIFDCVFPTVSYFFHVIEVPHWDRLTYESVDQKGAILRHPSALDEAAAAGSSLADALAGGWRH